MPTPPHDPLLTNQLLGGDPAELANMAGQMAQYLLETAAWLRRYADGERGVTHEPTCCDGGDYPLSVGIYLRNVWEMMVVRKP